MNKFINLYIFSLIIVIILNINYIHSFTITFNNNIISNCNISNPCDLSSRSVWVNNETPIDGDDVVIDLSTIKSKSNVYLYADGLNLDLNSFTFNGQQSTYSSLIISNSNLTFSTEFNIYNSNVTFYDDSNTNINITTFISTYSNVITKGSATLDVFEYCGIGGSLTVTNSSYFVVSGSAMVDVNVVHTSIDILGFLGKTLISSQFYSNGNVQFNGPTTITHSASFTVIFVQDTVVIRNQSSVSLVTYVELTNSLIQVMEGSSLSIYDPLIHFSPIVDSISLYNNSILVVASGFTFSNNNAQMNGTIYINDANYLTTLIGANQPGLTIEALGDITMVGTTLGSLSMTNSSSNLEIRTQCTIYKAIVYSFIYIDENGSLTSVYSLLASVINVLGTLNINGEIYANTIYIEVNGILNSKGQVNSVISCLEGTVSINSNDGMVKDIQLQHSELLISDQSLSIQNGLTIEYHSMIKFNNTSINSKEAMVQIQSNGYVSIDKSTTFRVYLATLDIPKNGDIVKLVSASNSANLFTTQTSVLAYLNTSQLILDINYYIEQDKSGNINLIFSNSHGNSSNKYKIFIKIGIIGGSVVGSIALITILIILIRRYRNHNNKNQENSPLIK